MTQTIETPTLNPDGRITVNSSAISNDAGLHFERSQLFKPPGLGEPVTLRKPSRFPGLHVEDCFSFLNGQWVDEPGAYRFGKLRDQSEAIIERWEHRSVPENAVKRWMILPASGFVFPWLRLKSDGSLTIEGQTFHAKQRIMLGRVDQIVRPEFNVLRIARNGRNTELVVEFQDGSVDRFRYEEEKSRWARQVQLVTLQANAVRYGCTFQRNGKVLYHNAKPAPFDVGTTSLYSIHFDQGTHEMRPSISLTVSNQVTRIVEYVYRNGFWYETFPAKAAKPYQLPAEKHVKKPAPVSKKISWRTHTQVEFPVPDGGQTIFGDGLTGLTLHQNGTVSLNGTLYKRHQAIDVSDEMMSVSRRAGITSQVLHLKLNHGEKPVSFIYSDRKWYKVVEKTRSSLVQKLVEPVCNFLTSPELWGEATRGAVGLALFLWILWMAFS